MRQRLILHADLDAFFASVEQRDRPEYRARPVVVGAEPGRRGVVAACSYEARRYGVHSAMPISEAARRLPPETVYVRPRMAVYTAVSREVLAALATISPVVEPVSIDEAYLDVSGLERLFGSPEAIGRRARDAVREAVGLSASVGIGPNRLVAKLASEHRKPDGLTVIAREGVQDFLDPMPLPVLHGVGAKTASALERMGLHTVGDVRRMPIEELRRRLGHVAGTRLYERCRGIASDTVNPEASRKSISKEITFEEDIRDLEVLRDTLRWAAREVGHTARREGLKGTVVTLKVRLEGFETHTRTRTLPVPTARDQVIFREGWALFQAGGWSERPVRLLGVGIAGWKTGAGANHQGDLFGDAESGPKPKEERIYQALDAVTAKFGKGTVGFGVPRRKG